MRMNINKNETHFLFPHIINVSVYQLTWQMGKHIYNKKNANYTDIFSHWQKPNTLKNEVQKLNQTQIIHTHCILFIHSDRVLRPTCHLLGTLKHQLPTLNSHTNTNPNEKLKQTAFLKQIQNWSRNASTKATMFV
jgi:hypothetical protein